MKFSHLVEINDPLNPLIDPLSRAQLWRGLVLRAEEPGRFMPWLDGCSISERSPESMLRALRYGEVVIRDRVTFLEPLQVRYHIPAQPDIPPSSLCMTIEEPQPGLLWVRFDYAMEEQGGEEDDFYNEFRRSAYQEADIDTIRIIRQLAAEGQLGAFSA
jgi:Domain of unknown function (DUF1857)